VQPTRRQALAGGAVVLAGACTAERTPRPQPVDPDLALLDAAIAREEGLVRACERALGTPGPHGTVAGEALGDHAAHLARLRWERDARRGAATGPPTSTPPAAPPARVPLAGLERAAARAHADAAATASRTLAPLLASLAACEATHAALLT
jgi:hypothetical protein